MVAQGVACYTGSGFGSVVGLRIDTLASRVQRSTEWELAELRLYALLYAVFIYPRSSFQHIKLPALLLLRQFAGERQYRVRLVTEGAGAALAAVANSSTYDGMTRAAAAALWMEVGCGCWCGWVAVGCGWRWVCGCGCGR